MEFLFSSSTINVFLDEKGYIYMEENLGDNYGFLTISLEELQEIVSRLLQIKEKEN